MYPSYHADKTPDKPAIIMASSGQIITYLELESTSNQIAHLFRKLGLKRGDHIAFILENHPQFFCICWAAQRAGLYYTAISHRLQYQEVAYIIEDSGSKLLITSKAQAEVAQKYRAEHQHSADIELFMLDGCIAGYSSWDDAVDVQLKTPIADQATGMDMLYSSGTTGKPKGVKRALFDESFGSEQGLERVQLISSLFQISSESIYLSPAPSYHAAPLRFNMWVQTLGGTSVIMDQFEELKALEYIEKYKITHSQWVPTMFVRMLKMPVHLRHKYDYSSHQVAIHAAAPCPVLVKEQMIKWWGPMLYEYYAGTEGNGFCYLNSEEWLAHKGSVGRALTGNIHIMDEGGNKELPVGEIGTIYFADGGEFEYHNDQQKTAKSRLPQGWTTLDDMGYVDAEGYLYLTDRRSFMIISGGVNIYPQEAEDILITHPSVFDCAVIGVPNEEFGEEVKAVVQPIDMSTASEQLAEKLKTFCRQHLAHIKCPRTVDFVPELPRHQTGKLYKRLLRDRYWKDHDQKRKI